MIDICSYSFGQESFKEVKIINVSQADSIFLAKNLLLLAERFNVNASKAQIIQARLYNNITLSLTQNVYDPERKLWFDASSAGETASSIQKLFLLAGKRNKRITLADLSYRKEEQVYFDMIRTLKFTLRSDFYNIYYLKQILKAYEKEINSLSRLISVFENQFEKGYASKKEVLRLKSTLFSLSSEKQGYLVQLFSNLSDFNMLLHTTNIDYLPQTDSYSLKAFEVDSLKLQALIDTACSYRYDLIMAESDVKINKANLSYQKALAVPDLTLSAGWDRNGSFVHNFNFISMQIDLPFFNRNQGNIKSAEFSIEGSKAAFESASDKVKTDVILAYTNVLYTNKLQNQFNEKFMSDQQALIEEIVKNYEKRNISTMEFLDYYDAYKNNIIQFNNLRNSIANALENLNFSVGKDVTLK
jgi:cobalt-zinc-cadmium efflux system outer membrane protein